MSKRILIVLFLILNFFGCKSKKQVITKKNKTVSSKKDKVEANTSNDITISDAVKKVLDNAKTFEGVKYKYGGTTKRGMDCSGLVYTSFKQEGINLPRTTADLSKTGDWIDLKEVKEGDLLFFATKKRSRKVTHVGIVTNSRIGNVEFIHASTSNGVMVSNLAERYWYFAFVQARRVL